MTIQIPGKVIVFDYGEVISMTPNSSDRAVLAELAGGEPSNLWASYWRHRDALDQGTLTPHEYWRAIGQDVNRVWADAEIYELWLADYRSWLTIDPGVLELLVDLKHGSTRMALLSNAGRDFGSFYRNGVLGDFFERVFVSGELGVVKPGRAIFETVVRELDVAAAQVIFVDNRKVNIEGAESLGIHGHLFTSALELRSFLQALTQ